MHAFVVDSMGINLGLAFLKASYILCVQLTVVASDQRGFGPQVRTTVGSFRINLLDVNDSIPNFVLPVS